ncbi:MAG TPA: SRPBCC domain-containing protein [Phycisphaerae bacterium]|nr:SRPBCC domain-containing protein [Phycisphaerae bacterium]
MANEECVFLNVRKEIEIQAPIDVAFAALLEQIGPGFDKPDGETMPMKLEAWPGGRWFRDLGNNTGHFWGTVQVIKPPTLLEITGPMFMSYPVASHVQYRLTEKGKSVVLSLTHRAMGEITPEHREGVQMGWQHIITKVRDRARR